jgi:hypothetical protein
MKFGVPVLNTCESTTGNKKRTFFVRESVTLWNDNLMFIRKSENRTVILLVLNVKNIKS